jgi:hypothetical protein
MSEREQTAPVLEGSGSESCAAPGPSGPCRPAPDLERATKGNRRLTAKSEYGDGDRDSERMCTFNVRIRVRVRVKVRSFGPALTRRH